MNANNRQREMILWLFIVGLPYVIMGVVTLGSGFVLLPLGATAGVIVGLFSNAPYFTLGLKLSVLAVLIISISLGILGWIYRQKIWGKALFSFAVYLWCFTGLVGFGPQ